MYGLHAVLMPFLQRFKGFGTDEALTRVAEHRANLELVDEGISLQKSLAKVAHIPTFEFNNNGVRGCGVRARSIARDRPAAHLATAPAE